SLRRRLTVGGVATDYVLDGQAAVRTLSGTTVIATWLHGPWGPEYERSAGGSPVWYFFDGLGSVTGTVDANGSIVSTRRYDVHGVVRGSTGPSATKHKFCGALCHPSDDETGVACAGPREAGPRVPYSPWLAATARAQRGTRG